jgi:opacity protein-like surface antigen
MDLGYLGPGVRVVPSVTYWSSRFKRSEVDKLSDRVADLVQAQTGQRPAVDLGEIDWRDVDIAVDAHVVWRVPFGVLTYVGAGASAHVLSGSGAAVDGTFVKDFLDGVRAGFDAHAGLEYPLNDRLRVYGQGRYDILGDLRYFQLRFGTQVMFSKPAQGEERR